MADYNIGKAFERIENELIASMIRNMKKHAEWEDDEGFQWEQWQAVQLKELAAYRKRNKELFGGEFKKINKHLEEAIRKAREEGSMQQELELLKMVRTGRFKKPKITKGMAETNAEFFKMNDRKMEALINATVSDMEKAETAILRMANDKYRKMIFDAQVYANSGAGTYEKAVDMATRDFLAAGLNCVEYKNGARHTLKDYAEMALRTASKRAYLTGEGEKRKEWGISTVIMNKRGNPCPQCLPWVGKILIDDVWSGGSTNGISPQTGIKYPLMSDAVSAGLYHPNCRDVHTTYFEGISTPPDDTFTKAEIKEIEAVNKAEAKKQYAKRQAEKFGRLAEYSLDKDNAKKYDILRSQWGEKAKNILAETKLKYPAHMKMSTGDVPLTDDDVYAINLYISSMSYVLNDILRKELPLGDEETRLIRSIDGAILKLPKYEGIVYRSVSSQMIEDLDKFNDLHQEGKVVNYAAYTSTGTVVYDETMDLQFIIKSKSGRDLREFNPNEQEILFRRGTFFAVVKREGNTIWMEEL